MHGQPALSVYKKCMFLSFFPLLEERFCANAYIYWRGRECESQLFFCIKENLFSPGVRVVCRLLYARHSSFSASLLLLCIRLLCVVVRTPHTFAIASIPKVLFIYFRKFWTTVISSSHFLVCCFLCLFVYALAMNDYCLRDMKLAGFVIHIRSSSSSGRGFPELPPSPTVIAAWRQRSVLCSLILSSLFRACSSYHFFTLLSSIIARVHSREKSVLPCRSTSVPCHHFSTALILLSFSLCRVSLCAPFTLPTCCYNPFCLALLFIT